MTLQGLDKSLGIAEVPILYRHRPFGISSKLNTFTDGVLVLKTIFRIFKDFRPFLFFSLT